MCSSRWDSWSSRAASLVGNQMGRQKTQGKPVARYHLRNAGTKTDPGDPALVPLEILVHRGLRGWRRHRSGFRCKCRMDGLSVRMPEITPGKSFGSKTFHSRKGQQLTEAGGRRGRTARLCWGLRQPAGAHQRDAGISVVTGQIGRQVTRVEDRSDQGPRRPRRKPPASLKARPATAQRHFCCILLVNTVTGRPGAGAAQQIPPLHGWGVNDQNLRLPTAL